MTEMTATVRREREMPFEESEMNRIEERNCQVHKLPGVSLPSGLQQMEDNGKKRRPGSCQPAARSMWVHSESREGGGGTVQRSVAEPGPMPSIGCLTPG